MHSGKFTCEIYGEILDDVDDDIVIESDDDTISSTVGVPIDEGVVM